MISVTISVGSNCGDRTMLVEQALEWLETVLFQTQKSDIYETPCALKTGNPYMNAVIKGFYQGDGFQLGELLKDKEHEMGRTSHCRLRGEVPIDMDIVIIDQEVIKEWDFRQKFFRIGFDEISDGSPVFIRNQAQK